MPKMWRDQVQIKVSSRRGNLTPFESQKCVHNPTNPHPKRYTNDLNSQKPQASHVTSSPSHLEPSLSSPVALYHHTTPASAPLPLSSRPCPPGSPPRFRPSPFPPFASHTSWFPRCAPRSATSPTRSSAGHSAPARPRARPAPAAPSWTPRRVRSQPVFRKFYVTVTVWEWGLHRIPIYPTPLPPHLIPPTLCIPLQAAPTSPLHG